MGDLLLMISMGLPKGSEVFVGLVRFEPVARCGLEYFFWGGDLYDGSSTLTFSSRELILSGLPLIAWYLSLLAEAPLPLVGLGEALD